MSTSVDARCEWRRSAGGDDLEVRHRRIVVDQVAVVLGVVDGPLDVVPGEPADRIPGGPEAERHDLGPAVAEVAGEHPGALVALRAAVLRQPGLLDVLDIGGAVLGAHPSAPDPGDHAGSSRSQATAAASPAVTRSRSSYVTANIVWWSPPPAHSSGKAARSTSTTVRSGRGCPTGATPPTSCPVAASTNSAVARRTRPAPTRAATLAVSTRCAPLARTSSGAPSASKTRLFAIAPTSQPSASAAAAAVGTGTSKRRTSAATPPACRAATTSSTGELTG